MNRSATAFSLSQMKCKFWSKKLKGRNMKRLGKKSRQFYGTGTKCIWALG